MPSKEHDDSSIISLRLPDGLLARLDRYLDWMESRQGEKSSRNHALRHALTQWLDAQEAHAGLTHPDVLRRHFQTAYTNLRQGQDAVRLPDPRLERRAGRVPRRPPRGRGQWPHRGGTARQL